MKEDFGDAPVASGAGELPAAPAAPAAPAVEAADFDLDLGFGAPPAPVTAAPPEEPFTLDLGLPDTVEVQEIRLDPALGWQDAPTPVAEPPQVELSQAEFDSTFGSGAAAPHWDDRGEDLSLEATAHASEAVAPSLAEFADTSIDLDFSDNPPAEASAEAPSATPEPLLDEEQFKVIGDLRIAIPLFNIYLNEADELSRRLCVELAESAMEPERPLNEGTAALAHSLAGSSATVGYAELSALARSLEHALMRSVAAGRTTPGEMQLFNDAAEEIRRLLHQFAAGFLRRVPAALTQRLEAHERAPSPAELPVEDAAQALPASEPVATEAVEWPLDAALPEPAEAVAPEAPAPEALAAAEDAPAPVAEEPPAPPLFSEELGQPALTAFADLPQAPARSVRARDDAPDDDEDIDEVDLVDEELFPIFRDEGEELLPQLQARMRDWARRPSEVSAAAACMRTLHTFKGGARLAGAMRLGEMAHRLETAIERLLARGPASAADVEALLARVDTISSSFDLLGRPPAEEGAADVAPSQLLPADDAAETPAPAVETRADTETPAEPELSPSADALAPAQPAAARSPLPIDWSRFQGGVSVTLPAADKPAASTGAVRVRAPLLDRLVNQAGEVSITRARIESDVGQIKGSLNDLSENLERLRRQLRDLELQAESQIASRMEAAKAASQEFDPLEMDRFTRFQELTRMMAESVNDVATVQRGLQRSLQATEDELASQARLTRDLQDDLLRTRMVEFESMADRLYRVVRQAAKESGKQVRLDIVGGSIEIDRGVLDRMTGPFEHLLRNGVAHGIEKPETRTGAGKDATGNISIHLAQEGNEVAVEFRDDGAGLNLARIRERALAMGLLAPDAQPSDADLANMIFAPGFSTADSVSELAGRGVGMDVVRSEVNAMGGRIETATAAGQGSSFRLVLPLTTAVTQVVMLRCGDLSIAVPSTLVEMVKRLPGEEVDQAYASGAYTLGDRVLPFFWLGALLQAGVRGSAVGRSQPVVIIRSASQRVALHVDEVLGNQEVVVKNLGPQLSRLPGLAGITLLPSGAVALIYNPVALATLYGDEAREQVRRASLPAAPDEPVAPAATVAQPPLVLVVDDSLTVRRVTQRLLSREGYRVALAKDGLDALDKLSEELPTVVLSDIEMPRMDGFDLVRNMRADARLASLPVIMITSRIAQKHRDYAAQLGVNHYLGKPYSEEELLALVGHYVQEAAAH
ncbi:MAG: response regulator [Burkholderiales bacterium]|nr:response regulator [Burkholderiales bacterium]